VSSAGITPQPQTGRVIPDDVWGILCIFAEARGEPYEGQVAVGNVIRNRTERKHFSNGTTVGTVSEAYQFSWMNHTDAQRTRVLGASWDDPRVRVAAKAWFESQYDRPVGDALFYHADYVHPTWAKAQGIELVRKIGRHLFYRKATVA
jgi:spore germination cell wall hydrolase CwlJ-like protein